MAYSALTSRVRRSLTASVGLSALLVAGTAHGQDQANDDIKFEDDEIVVTGTLIRGIAPAGSNVIGLGEEQVEASGGTTTNEVLASLPQVSNYFSLVPAGVSGVAGANASNPISRPNLRSLPAANTSGGAQTLVLLDGHRVVGAGTEQIAVDPDIFGTDTIQRVEAMTDGGSAVYGSDALGGVLNFITLNRFDGVKVRGRVGLGEDYESYDGGVMVGRDWGSGGIYVAYNYSHRSDIFGSDRDYAKRIDWNTGIPAGRNCADPNVTVNGTSYVTSNGGLTAGGPNVCDPADDIALFPENESHNVFAKFNQELSPWLTAEITALWANRKTTGNNGTIGLTGNTLGLVTIDPSNPFYRDTGDANSGMPQTVEFNYAPALGARSQPNLTELDTWSVAPSLKFTFGEWQVRPLFSYGESKVSYENTALIASAQAAAFAAGQINPYDIGSISQGTLDSILGTDNGFGKNEFTNARVIADGPLFALPAGDLRVAVGVEWMKTLFSRQANTAGQPEGAINSYRQEVKSVFGELQAPILSEDSPVGSLNVSVSGRYDDYNDFGNTFNPKVGITWAPTYWFKLRGNWGESFNAPSPVDQLGPLTSIAAPIPSAFLQVPPGTTINPGEFGVFLGRGSVPGLQPQTAKTWSVGFNVQPPVIPGLSLDVSYYQIDLKGTIGRPVTGVSLDDYFVNFPSLYAVRPTGAELQAFLDQVTTVVSFTPVNPNDTTNQAQICLAPTPTGGCNFAAPVVAVLDTLTRNLGQTKMKGIDWDLNLIVPTGFGSVDARFAGNYRIDQKSKLSPTAPVIDDLQFGQSRLRFVTTIGAQIGKLRAQASWNHTSGYDRATPEFGQTKLGDFNVVDLFFRYDFGGTGLTEDLSLTLNVQNVLDEKPPVYKNAGQNGYDPSYAFTLGRIFQLGFQKKF